MRWGWSVVALAGAAPAADGYPDGQAVAGALNAMRAPPGAFADALSRLRALFDPGEPLVYHLPGDPVGHVTREGARAVEEAAVAVRASPALPALTWSPLLAAAARLHVDAQGPGGAVGHGGAGAGPGDRAVRAGGDRYVAETISYGAATPAEVIRQLVIDDGVPSRGHRRILLSPEYRFVGAACGYHAQYRVMCVLDFGTTATGAYAAPVVRRVPTNR